MPAAGGARGAGRKRHAGRRAKGDRKWRSSSSATRRGGAGPGRALGVTANQRARGLRAAPAAAILWEGGGEGQSAVGTVAAEVRRGGPSSSPESGPVPAGWEGGSPQRWGTRDLHPRRHSLRVPGAACPLSARRERGVASVAGQGHRAPLENSAHVVTGCLPVLGRAPRLLPRLLHWSGARKDDLGFSSLSQ